MNLESRSADSWKTRSAELKSRSADLHHLQAKAGEDAVRRIKDWLAAVS
jgi:hypothetical protein